MIKPNHEIVGTFPFGQPVKQVVQTDRKPKKVFVLGVYASAVHARWIDPDGKTKIKAMAVATEPYIFWRGEEGNKIIDQIQVPDNCGHLELADSNLNGPSGIALDELILNPLGYDRNDAWLCDLVPHSCMNPSQAAAIDREYRPLISTHNLPVPTWPTVPKTLADETRRQAILQEITKSQADLLILLGDQPIRWFLRHHDKRWQRLSDMSGDSDTYGNAYETTLSNQTIKVIGLAHPRQIAKLGRSSEKWFNLHQNWLKTSV